MKRSFALLLLAVMVNGLSAELGSPAPPLNVSDWICGTPFHIGQVSNATAYVLVFWETGCKGCVRSLPTLSRLQDTYGNKGLVLAAVSPDSAETIKAFLSTYTNKINFRIATDRNHELYGSYMQAFGDTSVPHAFIIDTKGNVVWHRHPLAGLEQAIQQILSGKFDFEAEKRAASSLSLQILYLTTVRTNSVSPPPSALTEQILSDAAANPWFLNNFAWAIIDDKRITKPDLVLARRAIESADLATKGTNSAFADTYARVLFISGDAKQAVLMQQRAVTQCTEPDEVPSLLETLNRYQAEAAAAPRSQESSKK